MTVRDDRLRNRIVSIGRRLYRRGLVAGTEGNLSARVSPEHYLCSPSGVCKGRLDPAQLCLVDADGKAVVGSAADATPVSSEIFMHLALYASNPDIAAVVHAHPPYATTFAVLGETIPTGFLAEAELFFGVIPTLPFAVPGTPAVGAALRPFARTAIAALLANHGAVTWGPDLESACNRMESLEAICQVIYQARLLGTPRPIPPDQLPALTQKRVSGGGIR